ncbi:MAG TPA: hypothetical protein VK586_26280 [Streptosporangiaceae bacterium]|nr:hypothetical protein [Streptosporangiaceae bacterium]
MACTRCGRTAPAGAQLCPGCEAAVTLPPSRRPGGPNGRRLVLVTAAFVLAAGTGAGLLLAQPAAGHGPAAGGRPSAGSSARSSGGRGGGRPSAGRPAGRMLRAAAGHPGPWVAITAGARGRPGAAAVAAFLTRYFAAINRHDYGGYLRLFGPGSRRSLSAARFRAGYGTTRDSAEALAEITAAGPGEVAAAVTFTSRQAPAASPVHAACVRWRITIYLARRDGRYVVENPPAGYAAADRAC